MIKTLYLRGFCVILKTWFDSKINSRGLVVNIRNLLFEHEETLVSLPSLCCLLLDGGPAAQTKTLTPDIASRVYGDDGGGYRRR